MVNNLLLFSLFYLNHCNFGPHQIHESDGSQVKKLMNHSTFVIHFKKEIKQNLYFNNLDLFFVDTIIKQHLTNPNTNDWSLFPL